MRKIFETANAHGNQGATCGSLGPRTGSVLATGGRDKDICLWTFTDKNAVLAITGFVSQVECVLFSWSETQIAGGNMSGAVKVWDIKNGQVVCNFAGHRGKIKCLAQNQFEHHIWASGAFDGHVKLWDGRSNQLITTYRGHSNKTVTSMEFSPDGRWLVTGGEDCKIKLWDIAAGKALSELSGHSAPLTAVQFHPNEYLLASSSQDKTVRFWDVETFECVSQSAPDSAGAIKCIFFDPTGRCLYSASSGGGLRVLGWEPAVVWDSESCPTVWADQWRGVTALAMAPSQQALIAVCIGEQNNGGSLSAFAIDATRLRPIYTAASNNNTEENDGRSTQIANNQNGTISDLSSNNPMRRSFHRPSTDASESTIGLLIKRADDDNETTSGSTTPSSPPASIRLDERNVAFTSRPKLPRSPPNTPVPADPTNNNISSVTSSDLGSTFTVVAAVAPQGLIGGRQSAVIHTTSNTVSADTKSASTSSSTFQTKTSKNTATVPPISNNTSANTSQRKVVHEVPPLVRGTSPAAVTRLVTANPRTVSDVASQPRTINSTVETDRNAETANNVQRRRIVSESVNSDMSNHADQSANEFAEDASPIGGRRFTLTPDDFLPEQQTGSAFSTTFTVFHESTAPMSNANAFSTSKHTSTILGENDCWSAVEKGALSMSVVLEHRSKTMKMVRNVWRARGTLAAIEIACQMNDPSIIVDLLNILNFRSNIWKLDLCVALLPQLRQLLDSKYETYVHTAVNSLRVVLRNFGHVIKNSLENIGQTPSIGVDISQEERIIKCQKCYNELTVIREAVLRKQKANSGAKGDGRNRHTYRELSLLLQSLYV